MVNLPDESITLSQSFVELCALNVYENSKYAPVTDQMQCAMLISMWISIFTLNKRDEKEKWKKRKKIKNMI